MKPELNWIIHLVKNGVACACCGEVENGFVQYACNCHTHGMAQYGHPDFQMVLNCSDQEIGRILNTLGLRVQAGERFHNGDLVEGIFLDCPVHLHNVVSAASTARIFCCPRRVCSRQHKRCR